MVTKPSLIKTLEAMEPGAVEHIPFGIWAHSTLRSCASCYGLDEGRKYRVRIHRAEQEFTIERIA